VTVRQAIVLAITIAGSGLAQASAANRGSTVESVTIIGKKAPVTERANTPVPCTNFDTPERCARQAARMANARERQAGAAAATSAAVGTAVEAGSTEAVPIDKVIVEADPEDREAPALSAQQKLEKAWGQTIIPDGPISYRNNNGQRVECEGRVLRNRQRLGLLSYLIPVSPCAASIDPRPGYLKPGY
jgi:hypothetical protein